MAAAVWTAETVGLDVAFDVAPDVDATDAIPDPALRGGLPFERRNDPSMVRSEHRGELSRMR